MQTHVSLPNRRHLNKNAFLIVAVSLFLGEKNLALNSSNGVSMLFATVMLDTLFCIYKSFIYAFEDKEVSSFLSGFCRVASRSEPVKLFNL